MAISIKVAGILILLIAPSVRVILGIFLADINGRKLFKYLTMMTSKQLDYNTY